LDEGLPVTPSGFATVGSSACEGGLCISNAAALSVRARLAATAAATVISVKRRRVSMWFIVDGPLLAVEEKLKVNGYLDRDTMSSINSGESYSQPPRLSKTMN
jgi:hypothetical protein